MGSGEELAQFVHVNQIVGGGGFGEAVKGAGAARREIVDYISPNDTVAETDETNNASTLHVRICGERAEIVGGEPACG